MYIYVNEIFHLVTLDKEAEEFCKLSNNITTLESQ